MIEPKTVVDEILAEWKRRWMADGRQRANGIRPWNEETAEKIWEAGEPIHRNAVEYDLSVLHDLGYRLVRTTEGICVLCGRGVKGEEFMHSGMCQVCLNGCPNDHTSMLVYDNWKDVMMCPICGHEQYGEMGG